MSARYVTWIDGEECVVELLSVEGTQVHARIESGDDGAFREVSFQRIPLPGGGYQLLMPDGRSLSGRAVDADDQMVVVHEGSLAQRVKVISERDAWLGIGGLDDAAGHVTVAMPGLVVKLLVDEGQAVSADDPVIVIEAMKMENEVKAGRSGVVEVIHVAAGDSVEADVVLMEIGDAPDDG